MQHNDLVRITAGLIFIVLVCLLVWRRKRR
jgi:hypothetical protein